MPYDGLPDNALRFDNPEIFVEDDYGNTYRPTTVYLPPSSVDHYGRAKSQPSLISPKPSFRELVQEVIPDKFSRFSTAWVFLLSIYSTILSTFWLLVAFIRPHWGLWIAYNGHLSPSAASTLAAGFAKSIEMTFVTVFVVCLGQFFTHRAKDSGIHTSDLQLKTLVVLPGAIFTQKGTLGAIMRRGFLGLACIIAFIGAALYTTASDALVAPRPSLTVPAMWQLVAKVQASMMNPYYVEANCPSPITDSIAVSECIMTEHAGSAFHNYMSYLATWRPAINTTQNYTFETRPPPLGLWQDTLPVQGMWTSQDDSVALTEKFSRLITTSSLAMPHMGLLGAANMKENDLTASFGQQVTDSFSVEAATVAPAINVTCATAYDWELVPLVYMNRSVFGERIEAQDWPSGWYNDTFRQSPSNLDGLFGWGGNRGRPFFYRLPGVNQTILDAQGQNYTNDMLNILLKSPNQAKNEYTVCGLNLVLQSGCSSTLWNNITGSCLSINCNKDNPMAFTGNASLLGTANDWTNTARDWAIAIALDAGTTDSSAAAAYLIANLAPTTTTFDTTGPSLADSLAILAICTLMIGSIDTPLNGTWSWGPVFENILTTENHVPFMAQVQVSDYSSGTTNKWENAFILILLAVMVLNIVCLGYLTMLSCGRFSFTKRGFRKHPPKKIQKDITDLHELFHTAMGSPKVDVHHSTGFGDEEPLLKKRRDARWHYDDEERVFKPAHGSGANKRSFRVLHSPGLSISSTAINVESPSYPASMFSGTMRDARDISYSTEFSEWASGDYHIPGHQDGGRWG